MGSTEINVAAEIAALADDLASPEWLQDQAETLTEEALAARLAWLHRQAKAGRSHTLPAFLGPETLVSVHEGKILIRQYVGVDVREV